MTDIVRRAAAPSPAPRHMHKRRFRGDVPPSQLPRHQAPETPAVLRRATTEAAHQTPPPVEALKPVSKPAAYVSNRGSRKATLRQKRMTALGLVILISISIPILVLFLMHGG